MNEQIVQTVDSFEGGIKELAGLIMAECIRTIDNPAAPSYNWATTIEDLPESLIGEL